MCFTDDIVLLAEDIKELDKRLQELNQWSNTINLRINVNTKIILNNSVLQQRVTLEDQETENVGESGTKDKHKRRTNGRNQPKDTAGLHGIWKNEGHF
jgi:regulator of replication initiation timing